MKQQLKKWSKIDLLKPQESMAQGEGFLIATQSDLANSMVYIVIQ
jgi:hypothetical protein